LHAPRGGKLRQENIKNLSEPDSRDQRLGLRHYRKTEKSHCQRERGAMGLKRLID
jgi:hypothetical protein